MMQERIHEKMLKRLITKVERVVNSVAIIFGYKLTKNEPLVYLHKYASYDEYANTQKSINRAKINHVWADDLTLTKVAEVVSENHAPTNKIKGICHGARNGYEVNKLREITGSNDIMGTDISETAEQFKNLITWDFHDSNPDWIGENDFIYSNSLDQSWKPMKALECWLNQIKADGVVIIEHTMYHSASGAGEGDPFGVLPEYFPYILCEHFGDSITIEIQKFKKSLQEKSILQDSEIDVWLFILRKKQ